MKVHETRSHTHTAQAAAAEEEHKSGAKKQKAEVKEQESEPTTSKNKKAKVNDNSEGIANRKSAKEAAAEFKEFCQVTREHLSIDAMRRILEANAQDPSGSDDAVVPRCQDVMFYGPLEGCPICDGQLEYTGCNYTCRGLFSDWSTCTYTTREPPRKEMPLRVPEEIGDAVVTDLLKKHDPGRYPRRSFGDLDKPFAGMMISLSGRLSRTHQYWKEEIEKHGGKVSNTVPGVACLVVSPAEREKGGSSKVVEAMERSIPVVNEAWLIDSIQKQCAQPLDAYDVLSDLAPEGKGIPWYKAEPGEEALEFMTTEVKIFGKRSVYKDSKLAQEGGSIFEKDGIIYNCALSLCDLGKLLNEYCVMQLIMMPDNRVYLYYKKGWVGDDPRAEERVEEHPSANDAVKEFIRLFEELTANKFEPWEREKKFEKKALKFFPIDMDDGVDVRYGGLGLRQLGVVAAHCKLEPLVSNFMKLLCSQEIYKYALMEMGHDCPDLPMAMLSDYHLKRCEESLLENIKKLRSLSDKDVKSNATWVDFSSRWFTLMHSTRPFAFRDLQEIADHAAAPLESIRDIVVASHLIGDMTGDTLDDPLFDFYKKLGCSISPVDKESNDYKMILKYVEKTYEPVKFADLSYGISVENIFAIESSACPSYDDLKKLPDKVLLWCGTRSSNLLRHLHKGFLPSICQLPVPGYMFGSAIVCSDAAAEAARYGFTAIDRPEGFLVLAVASLGDEITEVSSEPEDTKSLEEKKVVVKGLGRKKTDESEHFTWKDDIKVPCGRLVPSGHDGSPLEYNEYALYDPKQVSIRFLVGVKYEEQDAEMVAAD